MRRRLEELHDALGGTGTTPAVTGGRGGAVAVRHDRIVTGRVAERDPVPRRLGYAAQAVGAIRRDVARVRAGSRSVQSLTTDLGLAREVASEINLLLEGHREIERDLT